MTGAQRILFLLDSHSHPQRFGGIEATTHDLCAHLPGIGCEVAVLSALRPGGALYFFNRLVSYATRDGAPVDRVNGYPSYRGWDVLDALETVVERFEPTACLIQAAGRTLALARACEDLGLPTAVYLHDSNRVMDKAALNPLRETRFLACSRFTAEHHRETYGIDAAVLPPLVDPERVRVNERGDRVVFINPTAQKGLAVALEVAKELRNIPFLFVKCWPLYSEEGEALEAATGSLPNVELIEATTNVGEVYARARVVLVPSQSPEGWTRVVAEAQINGIPVVASRTGGLPEAVGEGGVLIDPKAAPERWVDAVRALYEDDTCYRTASERALRRASQDDVSPRGIAVALSERLRRLSEAKTRRLTVPA